MLITIQSKGREHSMSLPITQDQIEEFNKHGISPACAFPQLTKTQHLFLKSGELVKFEINTIDEIKHS